MVRKKEHFEAENWGGENIVLAKNLADLAEKKMCMLFHISCHILTRISNHYDKTNPRHFSKPPPTLYFG